MKRQDYVCDKCGIESFVYYEDGAGVWEVIQDIDEDHKKWLPRCDNPVSELRLLGADKDKRWIEYLIGVTEELGTFVKDADALAEDRHRDSFGDSPHYEGTPPHRKHCMLLEKISKLREFIENVEGGER